jgi:hypothetical protein
MPLTTSPSPELGDPAPLVRTEFDARNVLQQNRRAAFSLEHDLLEVGDALEIAAAADDVLGLRHLDHPAADVSVSGANGLRYPRQRDSIGLELSRVDDDLVLLHEAADARDLGHALGLR